MKRLTVRRRKKKPGGRIAGRGACFLKYLKEVLAGKGVFYHGASWRFGACMAAHRQCFGLRRGGGRGLRWIGRGGTGRSGHFERNEGASYEKGGGRNAYYRATGAFGGTNENLDEANYTRFRSRPGYPGKVDGRKTRFDSIFTNNESEMTKGAASSKLFVVGVK